MHKLKKTMIGTKYEYISRTENVISPLQSRNWSQHTHTCSWFIVQLIGVVATVVLRSNWVANVRSFTHRTRMFSGDV